MFACLAVVSMIKLPKEHLLLPHKLGLPSMNNIFSCYKIIYAIANAHTKTIRILIFEICSVNFHFVMSFIKLFYLKLIFHLKKSNLILLEPTTYLNLNLISKTKNVKQKINEETKSNKKKVKIF